MAKSDSVQLRGLRVDCVVGVYPSERDQLQPLLVDLDLMFDAEEAATSERLSKTVDYHFLSKQVDFLLKSARFQLLETAAYVLLRYVLGPKAPGERRAEVDSATVRLTKPEALGNPGVASLEMTREKGWVTPFGFEEKPFGTVDIVHETRDAGIYRLNVGPGLSIPLHEHRVMRESEMILSEGLHCQGKPVAIGDVHQWSHGERHVYENPTDRIATILCVDSPPFIEEDERVL